MSFNQARNSVSVFYSSAWTHGLDTVEEDAKSMIKGFLGLS
jgi:hypothetical protein